MSTEVFSPRAIVEVSGFSLPLQTGTEVTLNAGINQLPRLTVDMESGKGGASAQVITLTTTDLHTGLKDLQASAWRQRGEGGDIKLTIEDGRDSSFSFNGLLSGASLQASEGDWSFSLGGEAVIGRLMAMNLSIYTGKKSLYRDKERQIKGDSVSILIHDILQGTVENWRSPTGPQAYGTEKTREVVDSVDKLNETLLPLFYQILKNSKDSSVYNELGRYSEETVGSSGLYAVNELIYDTLVSQGGNFMAMLSTLGRRFQMWIVPSADGTTFTLQRYDNVLAKEPTTLTVDSSAVAARIAAPGGMPITHAAVVAKHVDRYRMTPVEGSKEAFRYGTADYYVARYPETPFTGGNIQEVPPPAWYAPLNIVSLARSVSPSRYNRNPQQRSAAIRKQVKELSKEADTLQERILNTWCKTEYLDLALGASTIGVTVPLSVGLNLKLGDLYAVNVRTKNDGTLRLGSGVLWNMSHNLTVAGSTGSAATGLTLSHFIADGFELPGL